MSAEVTSLTVKVGDITQIKINNTDITSISVQTNDTTILTAAPATVNLANFVLSDSAPSNISRSASAGVSALVSRSDHAHSAADLLLDGGNY